MEKVRLVLLLWLYKTKFYLYASVFLGILLNLFTYISQRNIKNKIYIYKLTQGFIN